MAPSRTTIAWALHEWHALLQEASASPHATRYQEAELAILISLSVYSSMGDLLDAFLSPSPELQRVVVAFCGEGRLFLFPHVVIGAACALRLHQLLGIVAS